MSMLIRPAQAPYALSYRDGCTGKVQFASHAAAATVQKRRERKGKVGKAYRCVHCGAYHIGRGPGRG